MDKERECPAPNTVTQPGNLCLTRLLSGEVSWFLWNLVLPAPFYL